MARCSRTLAIALLPALPVVLASCADAASFTDVTLSQDETVELSVGESVLLDQRLELSFHDVASDSRCPVDVTCVWEGSVAVVLTASTVDERQVFTLNTSGPGPPSATVASYTIELLGVDPEPVAEEAIPLTEYRATLRVVRD